MSETTIVHSRAMVRVDEIPPNANAIQAAREILYELRQGGGDDSSRRIEELAESLGLLLRIDGSRFTHILMMLSNLDDSPGEYEPLLSKELARLKNLEHLLKRFRNGDDGAKPSHVLIKELRAFVQSQAVRFRLPFLTGKELESIDDVLRSLGAVRKFVPVDVARRVGPVREDERKALPHVVTVKLIMELWPNLEDRLYGVTESAASRAIENELSKRPTLSGYRVPKKTAVDKALRESRGRKNSPGAGRAKALRPQSGEKRRNGKRIGEVARAE